MKTINREKREKRIAKTRWSESQEAGHWSGEAECVWSLHCMSGGECRLSSCQGQGRRSVCPSHIPSLRTQKASQSTKNNNNKKNNNKKSEHLYTAKKSVKKTNIYKCFTFSLECVLPRCFWPPDTLCTQEAASTFCSFSAKTRIYFNQYS